MNSHFWHFHVFYYIWNLKLQLLRALVLILQCRLHFYLKRGTNNNHLFLACDIERFGFYALMLYGFVFDGWNSTYFKKLLYTTLLTSSFTHYIFSCWRKTAEVQSWRQSLVKMGLNVPECSIHIISDLSFYGAVSPIRRIYGSRNEGVETGVAPLTSLSMTYWVLLLVLCRVRGSGHSKGPTEL